MKDIKKYPTEFANTFTVCFKYFERVFFTFDTNISIWRQYGRLLFILPIISIHFSSMLAYVVKVIADGSGMFQNAHMLPTAIIILQAAWKYILLAKNKRQIKCAIIEMGSNWRVSDISAEQRNKRSHLLKTLITRLNVFDKFVVIIFVLYILGPLAESTYRRLILHEEFQPLLPFECVYPFTITEWWTYLMMYFLQLFSMATTVQIYLGIDMFLITLCVHLSNEFIHLQEDLSLIKPKKSISLNEQALENESSELALKTFIVRHQNTIRLTRQIAMAFNKIVFINLLFTTINICFFTLAARTSVGALEIINNLGSGFIIMLSILVICYNSESLSESSTGIGVAAYKNLWYEMDTSYQKTICIIIMRSQKPCVLTSLEYFAISLKTFTKVLSTTYSYFSLANHLYEKRN